MSPTSDLIERLRRWYGNAGAFAHEVSVNGMYGSGSRCDALFAGFTSGSGRLLIGHEVKVSRSDWQHELDRPSKADTWHDACQEWWVVAPSTAIVDPSTLPAGWGLLVPSARGPVRFDKVVPAKRRDFDPPWWAVRSLIARLDTLTNVEVERRLGAAVKAAVVEHERRNPIPALEDRVRTETAVRIVARWKEHGIDLTDYGGLQPAVVAELLPSLLSHQTAQRAFSEIADQWRGAAHVAARAQELSAAVDALVKAQGSTT